MYPSLTLAMAHYRAAEMERDATPRFARSITLAARRRDELARRELRAAAADRVRADRARAGRASAGRARAGRAQARPASTVAATADTGAAAALAPCGAC